MINETINREASKQSTGFRFQKQRVVMHVLDAIKISQEFFFAIEYLDDIYGNVSTQIGSSEFLEQDKYYDENTSFTFSSKEVYTSIINFLENWLNHKRSNAATYIFVSTNQIGKENNTETIKKLGIKLPDVPILQLIANREYRTNIELVRSIKTLIVHKYEIEYQSRSAKAYLQEIINLNEQTWINFLDRIEYLFEQANIDALKKQVFESIKGCHLFDATRHKDKEDFINSKIIDLLDERQSKAYPAKFITYSDVKNIFLELAQLEQSKPDDPHWDSFNWGEFGDLRGIDEKIIAVVPNYNVKKIKLLLRKVANAYTEEDRSSKQQFLAQKYRIFMKCSELLIDQLLNPNIESFTEIELDNILEKLYLESAEELRELSKTYHYPYNNKETIKGMILNLFNECYLAFDDPSEENKIE